MSSYWFCPAGVDCLPFECGLSRFSAGLAREIGRVGRQSMDGPQGLAGIALLELDYWMYFVVELGFYSAGDGPSRWSALKFLPSVVWSLGMATSLTVWRI
jgi:hypothetical protein